jgi:hypothetical protein
LDPGLGVGYPTLAEMLSERAPSLTAGDTFTFAVAATRLAADQLKDIA